MRHSGEREGIEDGPLRSDWRFWDVDKGGRVDERFEFILLHFRTPHHMSDCLGDFFQHLRFKHEAPSTTSKVFAGTKSSPPLALSWASRLVKKISDSNTADSAPSPSYAIHRHGGRGAFYRKF